ncbi:ABC transport system integral membrane protein [Rhodococcus sp. B7740]|uniref:ABC transporter permease n=1 Tax=Rhodococcus sp. B7740 TaxID=1564114 RepID=UPI0005D84943|nr:ABC transporter permease [Rhodococcus sp. B7740]AJW41798.1 ABC transport system integral membrane protein [Rhodococcus sp. B7740]
MLAAANLRTQWRSFLAALLATTFGVAVISATLIFYDSSRPVVQPRLEGAAVLVLPTQADNEFGNTADFVPWSANRARQIAADLSAVPGADAVVVDRSFYAQPFIDGAPVEDEAAQDAGHGWSSAQLTPYRLISGAAPARSDDVVVPTSLGLTAGDSVSINLAAGATSFTVSGTLDGPGIYFTDGVAAQLDPGVRAIGIVASPDAGIDELARAAAERLGDRGRVATGADRAALEPEFVSHRRNLGNQLIIAMSTIGLFTTMFVVGSTFALTTAERRREIGLLRIVGAATGQVRRMVLGEAAAIGLIGGLVGAAIGTVAAPAQRMLLLNLDVQPPDFRLQISAWPLLVAVGVGVCVAVIGAWAAAGSATRVAPMEALLEAAVERRPMTPLRWIAALVALTGGLGATALTATAATDSRVNVAVGAAMLLILAAALFAPVVIGPIADTVIRPLARRSSSAATMLVRAALNTGTRRAAATAAPVIAAVGFAVLLSGIVQTMAAAYPAEQAEQLHGLALVTPDGTAGLSDQVVAETGAGPIGTRAGLPTRVFVPGAQGGITVVDAVGSLDERYAAPGTAVLDESTASLLAVQGGETMSVTFADGRSESVVVSQVLPLDPARGQFVLPRDLVREHDPSALTDAVFVPADSAPTHLTAGARVEDAYSFALDDYMVDARLTNWLAAVLITMAVGYSGLAVVNSMAMSAHRRRPDTVVLKLSGGTDRQLMSTAVGETAAVVLIGAALGLIVTLPPLLAMAAGLSQVTETEVGLHIEWSTVLGVVGGCLVLATAATAVVTRRGLRARTGVSGG